MPRVPALPPVRWLLAILCLALALTTAPGVAAQETDRRVDAVIATAIAQSRQLENGNLTAVYDRVHPDVRNLLPRQAFAAWLTATTDGMPLADPVVDTVAFTEWTSSLTGMTYPAAALVSYTHLLVRQGIAVDVSGTWVFAYDGERWRWLPDLPVSELEAAARAEEAPGSYLPTFRQAAYVRIDRFWQAQLFAAGIQYYSLDIVPVTTDTVATGCGDVASVPQIAIFYCVYDATVYFDPGFRERITDDFGAYGWALVIAHEWGHHIQAQLGIDVLVAGEGPGLSALALELQADCLAAIYTQDAFARGDIGQDELDAASALLDQAGDGPATDPDGPGAHGTSDERLEAFDSGFNSGFAGCDVRLKAPAA